MLWLDLGTGLPRNTRIASIFICGVCSTSQTSGLDILASIATVRVGSTVTVARTIPRSTRIADSMPTACASTCNLVLEVCHMKLV